MLTLRTLTASLLLTVILASVGSGLLLDKLYAGLHAGEQRTQGLTETQLEAIGAQLAGILHKLEHKEEFILAWEDESTPLSLEVISQDDIRMPAQLFLELQKTGHITLSSATSASYYFPGEGTNYFALRAPLAGEYKQNSWLPIAFTFAFYVLLILVVFVWLLPLLRRLQNMQLSAKKLGEGDLGARIIPSAISQIKDIELEFNRMAQRIEELVSDISLLSSAISHELRAPLAKLQFGLDALREEDNIEKRHIYENRLEKVINDMTHLIETLLKYARLDKAIAQLPKDEVDLLTLCDNAVSSVNQSRSDKPTNIPADIKINADQSFYIVKGNVFYFNLLVENLLSNAVKYGAGKILISLYKRENDTLFILEDNGPGIDEKFRQDIFKPFIRGEEIRNGEETPRASQKGYGLGMALVKRIADLHNVKIEIAESACLGGAQFTLTFIDLN